MAEIHYKNGNKFQKITYADVGAVPRFSDDSIEMDTDPVFYLQQHKTIELDHSPYYEILPETEFVQTKFADFRNTSGINKYLAVPRCGDISEEFNRVTPNVSYWKNYSSSVSGAISASILNSDATITFSRQIPIVKSIPLGGNKEAFDIPTSTAVENRIIHYRSVPFSPATSSQDGTGGSVPAPKTTDSGKFLCSDGTWKTVTASGGSTTGNYLPLTGGTLSGNLTVDRSSTTSEADMICKGAAGSISFYSAGSATGNRGIYARNAANNTASAILYLNQSNEVLSDAAWHFKKSLNQVVTNFDITTNPTSVVYGTGFTAKDKNYTTVAYTRPIHLTDGTLRFSLEATRKAGTKTYYCNVSSCIDASGNLSYYLSSPAAFRKTLGFTDGIVPKSLGGTGITATSNSCLASDGLLYNIGVRAGTSAPSTNTGRVGWIYIQYA